MPHGVAVAAALRRALRLAPVDLPALAGEFLDDVERQAAWDELETSCGRESRAGGAPAGRSRARTTTAPPTTSADLAAVVSLVRGEVLDWTWQRAGDLRLQIGPQAVAVVCDGVAACYVGSSLSPTAFARLRRPWTAALRRIEAAALPGSVPEEFGPGTPTVRRIGSRLASAGPADLVALHVALEASRRSGSYWVSRSEAVSCAVELSRRLRPAAAAQLGMVRALPIARNHSPAVLTGAVRAVTAAVRAAVVADLLDAETYDALTRPWRVVFGRLD